MLVVTRCRRLRAGRQAPGAARLARLLLLVEPAVANEVARRSCWSRRVVGPRPPVASSAPGGQGRGRPVAARRRRFAARSSSGRAGGAGGVGVSAWPALLSSRGVGCRQQVAQPRLGAKAQDADRAL